MKIPENFGTQENRGTGPGGAGLKMAIIPKKRDHWFL
jgi:hypothetical protein